MAKEMSQISDPKSLTLSLSTDKDTLPEHTSNDAGRSASVSSAASPVQPMVTIVRNPDNMPGPQINVLLSVKQGNYGPVLKLIKEGKLPADSVIDTGYGWYLAHFMASHGRAFQLRILLKKFDGNPNVADRFGQTPLHIVTSFPNLTILKVLLQHPLIQVEKEDALKCTPILNAAKQDFLSGFIFLYFEKGAKLSSADNNGLTIPHWAASKGNTPLLRLLRHLAGADFNAMDSKGYSMIHHAISSLSYETVKYIASHFANSTKLGMVPALEYARQLGQHPHIIRYLEDRRELEKIAERGACRRLTENFGSVTVRNVVKYEKREHGKVMFYGGFAAVVAYMLTTFINFCHSGPVSVTLLLASFMGAMISLHKLVRTTDPGYLPKKSLEDPNSAIAELLEKYKDDEWTTDSRYCFACLIAQPRSAQHCDQCDRCVAGFHCHLKNIYSGVCLGENNFALYFSFVLFSALGLWVYLFAFLSAAMTAPTAVFPISIVERFCAVWNSNKIMCAITVFMLLMAMQISYHVLVMLVAGTHNMTLDELRRPHLYRYLFKIVNFYGGKKNYVWTSQSWGERCRNLATFLRNIVSSTLGIDRGVPRQYTALEEVRAAA